VDQTWTRHARSRGQRRSASRTLAGKETPAGCPRQASPARAIALLGEPWRGLGQGHPPYIDGLSLVTGWWYPSTLRVQTTRTMVGAWTTWTTRPISRGVPKLVRGRWGVGFEAPASVLHQPCSRPQRRFELRFVPTCRDRSCPARTGGSQCRADPARTSTAARLAPVRRSWTHLGARSSATMD
jgi:hypothetical protein